MAPDLDHEMKPIKEAPLGTTPNDQAKLPGPPQRR
jgi:hypothetical protein